MTDDTQNENQIDQDRSDDEVIEETAPKSRKRLGFWGWLLVCIALIAGAVFLIFPRLDKNSEWGQRIAALPGVGDYYNAQSGDGDAGSTDSADGSDEGSTSSSTDSDQASSGDGDASAEEQIETAVNDTAQAGEEMSDAVNEEVDAMNGDEASEGSEGGEPETSANNDADAEVDGDADGVEAEGTDGEADEAEGDDETADAANADDATSAQSNEEVEKLQAEISDLQAQLAEQSAAAEEATTGAAKSSAVEGLRLAALGGEDMDKAISDAEAAGVEVPSELKEGLAEVPTAVELQNEFGDYANEALRASNMASGGDGFFSGIRARISSEFLGRSLTPQEGMTPDAVLSRADDELRKGNLQGSVSELSVLPSEAQEAMSPWIEKANQRLDVLKAIAEIPQN